MKVSKMYMKNRIMLPCQTEQQINDKERKILKTRHRLPLILGGVNTVLIFVLIAEVVYLTWKRNSETKLIESIMQKLDKVNPKFEVQLKNNVEWRSNNQTQLIESIIHKLDKVNLKFEVQWKTSHAWRSINQTKLLGSIIKKLDEVNSTFKGEWKNNFECRCSSLFRCERDWKVYEGHCYYFDRQNISFDDAMVRCASLNSSLVKIEDEAEDHWLKKYLTADTWIGGKNLNKTYGNYTWLDRTPLVYKGWHKSQPDGSECCMQYWHTNDRYAWDDTVCYVAKLFVCEKNAYRINVIN